MAGRGVTGAPARAARLATLLLGLAAAGCGGKAAEREREREIGDAGAAIDLALMPYLRQLAPLAKLEAEALDAVRAHTGDRYTTDEVLLEALRTTAIPRYRDFALGLGRLVPPPGARAPLHEKLLVLAGAELQALEQLADALERGDGNAVIEVNREQRRLADEIDALLASWSLAGAPPRIQAPGVPAPAPPAPTSSTPSSDANSPSR